MLTSVGSIDYDFHKKIYEVVSDVKFGPTPDNTLALYSNPSIKVFDEKCKLIWEQSYDDLDEIGFRTIKAEGQVFLHVVGETVFLPVDDHFTVNELLLPAWGSMLSVTPSIIQSSRSESIYIGPLGKSNDLVIAANLNNYSRGLSNGSKKSNLILLYKWENFSDSQGNDFDGFSGPEIINATRASTLGLSTTPTLPDFPLDNYISSK